MKKASVSNPAPAANVRRDILKSLLALASGAASLGALAPAAQAGIFYTDISQTVGFGTGQLATYNFVLPGSASITINRAAFSSTNRIVAVISGGLFARQWANRSATVAGTNVALRTAYGFNWNNAAPLPPPPPTVVRPAAAAFGNIIRSTTSSNNITGPGAFNTSKYLLFQFQNTAVANQTQYGWVGMSEATITPGDKNGMSVTFTGIAYDDSGAMINAGDVGAVPEASTGVVSALVAALVVGSESLRRWRKAKPAKVSQPA